MDALSSLVQEFWVWTQLPAAQWNKADISKLPVQPEEFPGLSAMRSCCISRINTPLSEEDLDKFLLCMAVDNEDEEILDACIETGTAEFIGAVVRAGARHPQPMARWQMAELLRRELPNREDLLARLSRDADAYVRKRAENVLRSEKQRRFTPPDKTGGCKDL